MRKPLLVHPWNQSIQKQYRKMTATTTYKNPRDKLRQRQKSHILALILSGCTIILLAAGALVTSTGSSLAVPDWPLAYGEVFPPMVGGILYEHGHRMIATLVGFITVILAGWLWWAEDRKWVKWLGLGALFLVILQGVMGGITVLYLLPKTISVTHALLAQLFFLTTVGIAQITADSWPAFVEMGRRNANQKLGRSGIWASLTLGMYIIVLLIGATMRHNNAGLAIPDFPLAYGGLIPPLSSFPLVIHFAHRVSAVLLVILVAGTVVTTLKDHKDKGALTSLSWALVGIVTVQFLLGGTVIWTKLSVPITTLHLVNGALLFGTTGLLLLRMITLAGISSKKRS